ncbi:hypothetical protein Daus18300_006025 [Diaporthe australafricana]|uniref:DUF6594 domain-containing protein n=1 Tax=Diaporthe australafricana TaxID=127596 RepID=A0ABR3WXX3_9PEZI
MSSGFVETIELERGTNGSQAPPALPEVGQSESGSCSGGQGSDKITPVTDEDDLDPGHGTGQIGLARLKSYDNRFNFYPILSTSTSLLIESLGGQVHRIEGMMEAQRKKIKAKHHVEPCGLKWGEPDHKRWEKLTTRLRRKKKEYHAAWINAKTIDEYECPREETLEILRDWLNEQHNPLRHMYNGKGIDATDFRMLGPTRGPIAKFVHETLPTSRPARLLMRPFRAQSSKTESFEYHRFDEKNLNRLGMAVSMLCISGFFVIPLVLMAYFDTNTTLKLFLVLVMCSLVSYMAQMTERLEGRRLILVLAYLAISLTLLK